MTGIHCIDNFCIKSESPDITFLEACEKVNFHVTKSANISAIPLEESLNVLLPIPSIWEFTSSKIVPAEVLCPEWYSLVLSKKLWKWQSAILQVRLELGSDEIYTDTTYYQQSGEWRIQKTWALWERIRYEENNETFSRVSFVVVIHVSHFMYSSDLCIIFL